METVQPLLTALHPLSGAFFAYVFIASVLLLTIMIERRDNRRRGGK